MRAAAAKPRRAMMSIREFGVRSPSDAELVDVVLLVKFHETQVPHILGLRKLSELREQRVQITAQLHAALLMRFEDTAHLIDDVRLPLEERLDQFLRDLILTDNSIHVSPD